MSGEQPGASGSGAGYSKAKKSKTSRVFKTAKSAKKNSKILRTDTQDPNQARLMEVFTKLSLQDNAATSVNDTEMGGNGRMDIKPSAPIDNASAINQSTLIDNAGAVEIPAQIDNASAVNQSSLIDNAGAVEIPAQIDNAGAVPDDIQAYYEQRVDDGEEAAAAIRKPKHRKRKNRKAKEARAYNIDGAQPIVPKKKEPSRPVEQVAKTEPSVEQGVSTLSYSNVVLPEANRLPELKVGPERNEDSDIESDNDYYQSEDERWEQDYEDQEHWYLQ